MSDPRLAWLASSGLASLVQSTSAVVSPAALASDPAVTAWIGTAAAACAGQGPKLLSAYVLRGEKNVRFTNEVGALAQQAEQIEAEVHLVRLHPSSSSSAQQASDSNSVEEFAKHVLITNTGGDAVQGLYELIHSVFAPKLLGSVGGPASGSTDAKLGACGTF
jgi:hypothetical protein